MRMSWPRSRRWMAKEWRKVWQGDPLVEGGFSNRILHRRLYDALGEAMAALETTRIFPARARRKRDVREPSSTTRRR